MITQPVIPRIPLALQASGGVTIDPVSGTVSLNLTALSPASLTPFLQAVMAALPTVNPNVNGVTGQAWNDDGVMAFA